MFVVYNHLTHEIKDKVFFFYHDYRLRPDIYTFVYHYLSIRRGIGCNAQTFRQHVSCLLLF